MFLISYQYSIERELIILLSTQIKVLRRRKGWSQAELARRLHISPSAVGMYEQGRREPSIETLIALSREFNVTIAYLVAGSNGVNLDYKIMVEQKYFTESLAERKSLSDDELLILLATEILKRAKLPENKKGNHE